MLHSFIVFPDDARLGINLETNYGKAYDVLVTSRVHNQRIDTTQIYTMIRPAQLKQAVSFYEEPARRMLESSGSVRKSMFEEHLNVPQTRSEFS
jgi:hypothetical protein